MHNEVISTLINRRSVRSFTDEPVSADLLEQILLSGQYAPSGGNNQNSHFIVIQNKKILSQLVHLVKDAFSNLEIYDGMYKSMVSTIKQAKLGSYDFTYGAPALLIVANKKHYANAMADSALCIGNMLNAAVSVGLGACYINQLHWLDEDTTARAFLYELGLLPGETVCGSLVIGNPKNPASAPLKRTGNNITMVD